MRVHHETKHNLGKGKQLLPHSIRRTPCFATSWCTKRCTSLAEEMVMEFTSPVNTGPSVGRMRAPIDTMPQCKRNIILCRRGSYVGSSRPTFTAISMTTRMTPAMSSDTTRRNPAQHKANTHRQLQAASRCVWRTTGLPLWGTRVRSLHTHTHSIMRAPHLPLNNGPMTPRILVSHAAIPAAASAGMEPDSMCLMPAWSSSINGANAA